MIDETVAEDVRRSVYERLANRAIANFKKRGLHAEYVPDRGAALSRMLEMIPSGVTVGVGDSMTLHQVGILPALREGNRNEIFSPFVRDPEGNLLITGGERLAATKKALLADFFISGTNAITLDGKMVNIDGAGNRVAPMIWGPNKVIVVVGGNKIVKDVDSAIKRVREVAAPLNMHRHFQKHHIQSVTDLSCYKAGICMDCMQSFRCCAVTVIIEGENTMPSVENYLPRMNIIIVGEQLGL